MTALVVMGERHMERLVEVNLLRQGYDVVGVATVEDCVERAHSLSPELIVIDSDMPGAEFLRSDLTERGFGPKILALGKGEVRK